MTSQYVKGNKELGPPGVEVRRARALPHTPLSGGKGRRKRRASPEETLQRSVKTFLDVAAPGLVWFSVPNGGGRSKAEAGALKATGVKAGVADLLFVLAGGRLGAIELKVKGSYQSPEQKAWQASLEAAGGLYTVARSIPEVEGTLRGWGVSLRTSLGDSRKDGSSPLNSQSPRPLTDADVGFPECP